MKNWGTQLDSLQPFRSKLGSPPSAPRSFSPISKMNHHHHHIIMMTVVITDCIATISFDTSFPCCMARAMPSENRRPRSKCTTMFPLAESIPSGIFQLETTPAVARYFCLRCLVQSGDLGFPLGPVSLLRAAPLLLTSTIAAPPLRQSLDPDHHSWLLLPPPP